MLPTNALALQVPQLQEMSDVLQATTGWSIRPVAGLMHPRDFLAGFAFKVRWCIAVLVVHSAHITPALTCVAPFPESTCTSLSTLLPALATLAALLAADLPQHTVHAPPEQAFVHA